MELESEPSRPPPRKPLEPYEVPSSGAFWMHDDRQGDDDAAARCVRARALPAMRACHPLMWTLMRAVMST